MAKRNFSVSFEVEGVKEFSVALDHTGKLLDDFSKPLGQAKDMLLKTWDINFLRNGSTIGEPWAPLAPSTVSAKARKYGSRRILEATGKMRKSFSTQTTKESLYLWNTTDYFKYHQSIEPRKKLPRRVMMKIDEKRRTEIMRNFTEYMLEMRPFFKKK